jgi:hypothetical protein
VRVDYQPVVPPHTCVLPPAEEYPLGTILTCTDVVSYEFNGTGMSPRSCGIQYERGVTTWRHRPTWIRGGHAW